MEANDVMVDHNNATMPPQHSLIPRPMCIKDLVTLGKNPVCLESAVLILGRQNTFVHNQVLHSN